VPGADYLAINPSSTFLAEMNGKEERGRDSSSYKVSPVPLPPDLPPIHKNSVECLELKNAGVCLFYCQLFLTIFAFSKTLNPVCTAVISDDWIIEYRRISISGTTFSGKKCLSGTSFHAI
jgi:hypothetical protein